MTDKNAGRKQPFCDWCEKDIGPRDYYYTANPPGGFDMREVLICDPCFEKPENVGVKNRIRGVAA